MLKCTHPCSKVQCVVLIPGHAHRSASCIVLKMHFQICRVNEIYMRRNEVKASGQRKLAGGGEINKVKTKALHCGWARDENLVQV
jgi:hypothetical protein